MIPRILIFATLNIIYGKTTLKLSNKFCDQQLRRINVQETLKFNKRCKRNNVFPPSLLQRPPIRTKNGYKIAEKNAMRYLNEYIQDGYKKLKECNREIERMRAELINTISWPLFCQLQDAISTRMINFRHNAKLRLIQKFENLVDDHRQCDLTKKNWIKNISNYNPTSFEKKVLEKGLNYAIPNFKRDVPKFIATVEGITNEIRDISLEEKTILRHQICIAINSAPKKFSNISKVERDAIKSLKSNSDIMIVPADKGCATVIINTNDYKEKVKNHLADSNTYITMDKDPSDEIRTNINRILKTMYDRKLFTREEYYHLFANSTTIPLFYALIKIHKIGYPIRPIVSFIGSPTYNVAKFLSQLLMPATNKAPQKLKNTYVTKEILKNHIIPADHSLVSFDVKTLFTCFPIQFALDCVKKFIEDNEEIFEKTRLVIDEIMALLKFAMNASFFKYDGKFYKQIKGTPMGSPASVVIAEIVMQALEKTIFDNISYKFWYRYVDDVIACIPSDLIDQTLEFINSIDSNIQFTKEKEESCRINYLDMCIIRKENGHLEFNVFRKETHTDKYLDFNSYHPLCHKQSTARSLFSRAIKICDNKYINKELDHITSALSTNSYPSNLIKKVKENSFQSAVDRSKKQLKYVSAPYIKGASERVSRILKPYDIELAHKPTNTIKSNICHMKDKRENQDKAGIVYQLECKDCNASYIGESGRCLKDRIKEHKKDVTKKNDKSNVYHHVRDTGHSFDFNNTRVLDVERMAYKRRYLESAYSVIEDKCINRAIDLNDMYHPVLIDCRRN